MDYLKRTNRVLVTLVIILLVLAILSFAKVVFTGMSGLEWGSVSDWFSTASSIVTTYIAYRAYKAAPNWFKQKSYEAGFDHVTNLIKEYDSIEHDIQKLYWNVIAIKSNDLSSSETWKEVESMIYRVFSLKGNLYACQRWQVNALPETLRCFERLKEFCEMSYNLQGRIYMNDYATIVETHKKLEDLKSQISDDSANFKINIHDYFVFPQ